MKNNEFVEPYAMTLIVKSVANLIRLYSFEQMIELRDYLNNEIKTIQDLEQRGQ